MQTVFVSHGGGPLPLLDDPNHQELVESLADLTQQLAMPQLIVVVSAHWEASEIQVTSSAAPSLVYDYYGFPPQSYEIEYPCDGKPEVARNIVNELNRLGLAAQANPERGLDHGVFVPLALMYPKADIPVLQISLHKDLDPSHHIQLGQALSEILPNNTLLVGSGFTFHNMKAFFQKDEASEIKNNQFEASLRQLISQEMSESARADGLIHWYDLPHARYCHPREEHLIPLMVCYGANHRKADQILGFKALNKTASHVSWL